MYKILALTLLLSSCTYSKTLKDHELVVPPFIQEESEDVYKVFKE